jgi:hypothetical protein
MDSSSSRKAPFIGKSRTFGSRRRNPLIVCRLIVSLTFAAVALHAGQAFAQGAFPAPLPGQTVAPASNAFLVPPVSWVVPPPSNSASDVCMKGFAALREEALNRGKLIKAASDRHASPDEACKLIGNFGQAEVKMMKYVETHSAQCGTPPQVTEQLKIGHKKTEMILQKVCAVAEQQQEGPAGPSLNDVLDFSRVQRKAPAGPVGDFDVVR